MAAITGSSVLFYWLLRYFILCLSSFIISQRKEIILSNKHTRYTQHLRSEGIRDVFEIKGNFRNQRKYRNINIETKKN